MPSNRSSSQQTFNTGLLEPEVLAARGGLQAALRSIETVCYHDDASITEMIVELSSRPHILEYILSSTFHTFVIAVGPTNIHSCSLGRQAFRKVIEVDCRSVPYASRAKRYGGLWH